MPPAASPRNPLHNAEAYSARAGDSLGLGAILLLNLRALCQRHHLAYDHDQHRANAQATRRAKAGTLELF